MSKKMSKPIRNPFKDALMRKLFDGMIAAHDRRHKDVLRPDGTRCNGNGMASSFWRGYDNVRPESWDRASKMTCGYAAYAAGRAVAKRDAAQ